ncbi:MAG: PocR ligand-binding domain-containing protein [Opitutaceae bacterium]|nr:PocR ligand-binding domain-containing protein [Opitutaceae bacterium]MBP9912078.1 PocR ligand-binding domain-containing protein [Opitutaceae bacterium]
MDPSAKRKHSHALVARLRASEIYRDYEKAFRDTTGLPINLRPIESFDLPHHTDPNQNPFCALMAQTNQSCAACLQLQRKVEEEAQMEPKTLKCFAGLCDSAVPVRVGENLVAFLQTGQILLHRPSRKEFKKFTRDLINWGVDTDLKRLEEAYFQTRVLEKKQYEAVLRLLSIFAQHLASLSNQLMVSAERVDSPMVSRAKLFIAQHQDEELSLHQVAGSVNTSAFYFCKMFKQATGLTFTDYLARLRIEKVKNLLLNPHKRISEAAFETGFQSLSQFNRVFRKITGEAPTVWRAKLARKTA